MFSQNSFCQNTASQIQEDENTVGIEDNQYDFKRQDNDKKQQKKDEFIKDVAKIFGKPVSEINQNTADNNIDDSTTTYTEDDSAVTTTTLTDGTITLPDGTTVTKITKPDGTIESKVTGPDGSSRTSVTPPYNAKTAATSIAKPDDTKDTGIIIK